ncbi:carbohydrate-binding protein [Ideonella margarita]|uniref:Carbohydrate-binding protein n=1 Tax=Ideonella margarita TaxID=2984191 RepID=A0ABU9C7D0_9BURK
MVHQVFGQLRNELHGEGKCLTLNDDRRSVVFAACAGAEAQMWTIGPAGQYQKIRSALNSTKGEAICLGTPANGTQPGDVTMFPCNGSASFSSQIGWPTITTGANGRLAFSNSYRGQGGGLLSAMPESDRVALVAKPLEAEKWWHFEGSIESRKRPVVGEKTALLVVGHFDGDAAPAPERVRKAVLGDGADFASLSHFLSLASRGKLTLKGTMLPGVSLGPKQTDCDHNAMVASAAKAARANGINPEDFDYIFVETSPLNCGWAGIAAVPGRFVVSAGTGYKPWVWTHEFGHSMGFSHPVSLRDCPAVDGAVSVGDRCTVGKIDDPTDTVGGGGLRLFPVDYRLYAGWLTDQEVPVIYKPGAYRLGVLGTEAPIQGFRIPRSDGSYLILEYRQAQEGFENWPANSAFTRGVIVRSMTYTSNGLINALVDATPASGGGMTDSDVTLLPGASLRDELAGKLLIVDAVDPAGASIRILDIPAH